jgi:uncharacterized heparinase superfamily protein
VRQWHFVRGLRPGQLRARLRLSAKRWVLVGLAHCLPALRAGRRGPPLPPRPDPPQPLFPPRQIASRTGPGTFVLEFLHDPRTFSVPFDWDARALEPGTQLWRLNLHYMEFLEGLADEDLIAIVSDWIRANPLYRSGYWRDSWNAFALSIRCVVWMQQLARRGGLLPLAFRSEVEASLTNQLRFLVRNLETDILGNHLIKNLKALLWAGAYFCGDEAKRWRDLGAKHLEQQLDEQVLADGCHYERSPSYHCQVFADLLECYQVLGDHPIRAKLAKTLARMAQVAADLSHPDGGPALFNDSGLRMAYLPQICLQVHRRLLGETVRPRRHIGLPQAGYYGLRHGDDLLLADCGDIAPDFLIAHGHGDMLSFECSLGGQRLIVDPGVYEYNAGRWRSYARSTAAHNTVTVDDHEQCDFFGAFRCGRRARARCLSYTATADGFVLEGSHDGFDRRPGRPRHVRRFEVSPARTVISDRVENGRGQMVRARLLVHPDWRIEVDGAQAMLRRGDMQCRLTASVPLRHEPAWWCPDMGVRLETRRLVIEYGRAPCRGEFRLERLGGAVSRHDPVSASPPANQVFAKPVAGRAKMAGRRARP